MRKNCLVLFVSLCFFFFFWTICNPSSVCLSVYTSYFVCVVGNSHVTLFPQKKLRVFCLLWFMSFIVDQLCVLCTCVVSFFLDHLFHFFFLFCCDFSSTWALISYGLFASLLRFCSYFLRFLFLFFFFFFFLFTFLWFLNSFECFQQIVSCLLFIFLCMCVCVVLCPLVGCWSEYKCLLKVFPVKRHFLLWVVGKCCDW